MSSVVPTSFLNMSSYITTLILEENGLQGKFPEDVFHFPYLQKFDLFEIDNQLELKFPKTNWSGPLKSLQVRRAYLQELPDSIGNLDLWRYWIFAVLRLNSDKFNGNFELDKLSELSKLEVLSLSDNALLSFTSASNANYSLSNLARLELSSCNISEFPKFVRNLEGLTDLDLSNNRIHVIEADMFLKLKGLKVLDLSHNIPLSVRDDSEVDLVLPILNSLLLSSCNITELSNFLTTQEILKYLHLSNNNIQGEITEQENNWGSNLLTLDLTIC
ncbi:hypothetical protein Godav_018834 [Gossypium davidsonii]|uniref:Uncharacterized protein n=2 Tax=Gossypium TaxID=3633 RepID=A0A7J8QXZ0_GOSDV|nr:hypothetical protein [Gossypium davidsonii]MBA0641312.1 hypothetical protein [Gossypium klotzschianum]